MKTVKLLLPWSGFSPARTFLVFFIQTVFFVAPLSAQYVYWDFTDDSMEGVSSVSYITPDDAYEGPGVSTSGFPDAGCSYDEPWSIRGWYNTSNVFDAIDEGDYVAFSLSVDPGYGFHINGISFYSNRSVNGAGDEFGPRRWAVYGSHDNYSSILGSGINSAGETGSSDACTFNSEAIDIQVGGGQSITFRVYAYGDAATEITTLRIDDFTVEGSVLPVELNHFSVQEVEGQALLHWETQSETTNDYFIIERSADAEHFVEIGRVRGAGTSHTPRKYQFLDDGPHPGISYYRLIQVDFDGTTTPSQTQSIRIDHTFKEIEVYPTLATNHLTISFPEPPEKEANLHFMDAIGREVKQFAVPSGSVQQQINIEGLERGAYILQYREGREVTFVSRFIKN